MLFVDSFFFNTIFVLSHIYPENPEETQVIVGSMNMGYISDTTRNRTYNLFRPKREPIPLGHNDGQTSNIQTSNVLILNRADCYTVFVLHSTACRHVMFNYTLCVQSTLIG